MLVSQDERRVDHFRRIENGQWILTVYEGDDAIITFPALGCEVPLSELYVRTPSYSMRLTRPKSRSPWLALKASVVRDPALSRRTLSPPRPSNLGRQSPTSSQRSTGTQVCLINPTVGLIDRRAHRTGFATHQTRSRAQPMALRSRLLAWRSCSHGAPARGMERAFHRVARASHRTEGASHGMDPQVVLIGRSQGLLKPSCHRLKSARHRTGRAIDPVARVSKASSR